ncbi:MAG: tetratricopeptide repeat protein, partial [Anaerolineales bacterium]
AQTMRGRRKRRSRRGLGIRPFRALAVDDDRRAVERSSWELGKLVRRRNFASVDEANAFLRQSLASQNPLSLPNETPADEAQALIYEAWEAPLRRRKQLARRALELWPDCADAYVLLGEDTATVEEAKDLFEMGVRAGERAVGPEPFKEEGFPFWGAVETRPYMRALRRLADALWMLGAHHQAIENFGRMLRLNPSDNQGVRYILAGCLLAMGDDEALGALLDQYPDDIGAELTYARALWSFRQHGPSAASRAALRAAIQRNPFVPLHLLERRLPRRLPSSVGVGGEAEAIAFTAAVGPVWWSTEGAMEWLDRVFMAFVRNVVVRPLDVDS